MLVKDLKKGMLLKFSPNIGSDFDDRLCGFYRCGDDYLFFSRTGYISNWPKCEGPFVYLGKRYTYASVVDKFGDEHCKKKPNRRKKTLVREVLYGGKVCTVWGYDFKHLEPID